MSEEREVKHFGGRITETKVKEVNGVKVGIIEGYIATWDLDRGSWGIKDQFVKGAFAESIAEYKTSGRPVRFKDHHYRTVGGFIPESLREDDKGLFGIAEVNLEVQQGAELYALAKQGIISDFSIGFSSIDDLTIDDIRTIKKAKIWEGSAVDEPMNPNANITAVKSDAQKITVEALKKMDPRTMEKSLRDAGFSKSAAKHMVSKLKDAGQSESDSSDDEQNGTVSDMSAKLAAFSDQQSKSHIQSMLEKVNSHAGIRT